MRASSDFSIKVPVGFDGEPTSRPLVRGPHAARTISSVGWKWPATETGSVRATPSKARTKCRYPRSEEHTSELQSQSNLVCRLLLEKKKNNSQLITKFYVHMRK